MEIELLRLIAGLSNEEMARELGISKATVNTHVNNLFAKIGVRTRAQVVAFAFESGVVTRSS